MPKRSSISSYRKQKLLEKNACYIITCFGNEFLCKAHPEGRCERGFFSLFLQVLYGMAFAKKIGIPYTVDFSNVCYAYSDPVKKENTNFWERLVVPKIPDPGYVPVYNLRYETHPLRIWNRNFLRQLNCIFQSEVRFQDQLQVKIRAIKEAFKSFRILGIHGRRTDHYTEIQPAADEVYMKKIETRISTFDKLFVATDDANFLEKLKMLYPDKIIAHDFFRSEGKKGIHDHGGEMNGLFLGEQALLDCISLSLCQHLILSPSNLSYVALVFQPELPYTLAESASSTWSRRKTLLAYKLNQWGIRKW
ncbi:hypothetical protein [Cyclobacterium sp.]|uniref:hypothetical protein n=1 Tax=Cyclobacterium sp. TaxID=1966343 RepID=UPI00199402AA|nr:hypothetical protein [Cyclobacterium sp.]MBD3627491.1 hypothetical protein [Cyclobacterium sp.]